jgi:hypothetical protein
MLFRAEPALIERRPFLTKAADHGFIAVLRNLGQRGLAVSVKSEKLHIG